MAPHRTREARKQELTLFLETPRAPDGRGHRFLVPTSLFGRVDEASILMLRRLADEDGSAIGTRGVIAVSREVTQDVGGALRQGSERLVISGLKSGGQHACVRQRMEHFLLGFEPSNVEWTSFRDGLIVPSLVLDVLLTDIATISGASDWSGAWRSKPALMRMVSRGWRSGWMIIVMVLAIVMVALVWSKRDGQADRARHDVLTWDAKWGDAEAIFENDTVSADPSERIEAVYWEIGLGPAPKDPAFATAEETARKVCIDVFMEQHHSLAKRGSEWWQAEGGRGLPEGVSECASRIVDVVRGLGGESEELFPDDKEQERRERIRRFVRSEFPSALRQARNAMGLKAAVRADVSSACDELDKLGNRAEMLSIKIWTPADGKRAEILARLLACAILPPRWAKEAERWRLPTNQDVAEDFSLKKECWLPIERVRRANSQNPP